MKKKKTKEREKQTWIVCMCASLKGQNTCYIACLHHCYSTRRYHFVNELFLCVCVYKVSTEQEKKGKKHVKSKCFTYNGHRKSIIIYIHHSSSSPFIFFSHCSLCVDSEHTYFMCRFFVSVCFFRVLVCCKRAIRLILNILFSICYTGSPFSSVSASYSCIDSTFFLVKLISWLFLASDFVIVHCWYDKLLLHCYLGVVLISKLISLSVYRRFDFSFVLVLIAFWFFFSIEIQPTPTNWMKQ